MNARRQCRGELQRIRIREKTLELYPGCCQQGHADSKTLHQQNPPVLNWGCPLTQVYLYNGCKTVVGLYNAQLQLAVCVAVSCSCCIGRAWCGACPSRCVCVVLCVCVWAPDMKLGHWVTGSMGHLGHLSRLGHRVIISTRNETRAFPVFEKMSKMQNVHLEC